jgi:hypothetical protein
VEARAASVESRGMGTDLEVAMTPLFPYIKCVIRNA